MKSVRASRARGPQGPDSSRAAAEPVAPAPPPDSSSSWRQQGRAALLRGEVAEALWYLRHAVQEHAEHPAAWQLLGRCFEEIGEEVRARRCYTLAARQALRAGLDLEDLRRLGAAPLYCFTADDPGRARN